MNALVQSPLPAAFDQALYRAVMGRFATGVTLLSFEIDGEAAGMTANAFTSVSMDPPLVLVSIRNESRFRTHVPKGERYGINFLAECQKGISGHFGGKPLESHGASFFRHEGVPLLEGSLAHIVCRAVDVHPAGDHVLYISEIEGLLRGEERRPLVFFCGQYREVQAHAPTITRWVQTTDTW